MLESYFSVQGKTALVTGGSRGIGALIARGFVENGVKTYISARNADELKATAEALSEHGTCIPIQADLSSLDGVRAMAEAVKAEESSLDILVNNAGKDWGAPLEEFPEIGWDKVMDLNVKAMFFLTQQLLPELRAAGTAEDPARIINISSANAFTYSHMDNYSYSASKVAVVALTKHLAAKLCKDAINVNAIAPGFFLSKMSKFLFDDEERAAEALAAVPMNRVGNYEDAAGTAIYLASKASAYMTGDTLIIDGGVVARS